LHRRPRDAPRDRPLVRHPEDQSALVLKHGSLCTAGPRRLLAEARRAHDGAMLPLLSPINEHLGVSVEDLDDGRVRLSLPVRKHFLNEVGLVHGGVASLLLDGAMGRAIVRTLAEGEMCATVHLSVQFLAAAPMTTIRAEGRVVKRGRSVAFLEGEV